MTCPTCNKEVSTEVIFCRGCDAFIPNPAAGSRAGLATRGFALFIDPLIGLALWLLALGLVGAVLGSDAGAACGLLFPLIYALWYLSLFVRGQTPGKKLLGLRVANERDGGLPGFGRMFVREVIGRIVSGLLLGLGYLWAIFDKDNQAWHDKIARTVVLKISDK